MKPTDAPAEVVEQVQSYTQALRISLLASERTATDVARDAGMSSSYLSRLLSGERPVLLKHLDRLCAATGTRLLRQYHARMETSPEASEDVRLAALLRDAA